jgi:hypothetical protein
LKESEAFEESSEKEKIPNFPEDQEFYSELDFNLMETSTNYK